MQLTDRLIKDTEKKQKGQRPIVDEDEEEETMTYQERRPVVSLNTTPGVFESKMGRGINSEKSIFDKTAIFRTEENP